MMPTLVSEIVALPGWNTPMLLLLAKATVILIAALGITVAMQRGSAGARHLVWLVTLGTVLLVPAVAAWVPPLRLAILPAAKEVVSTAPASISGLSVQPKTITPNPSAPVEQSAPIVTQQSSRFASLSGLSLLFSIWAAVALVLGAWLAYGALSVRRIVRSSHELDSKDWLTPLWEVSDRLALDEPPRLLSNDEAKMPFACGFLKPTIVLPSDCETWSADRRRAVLLHELAHVKRHDLVGHTLGRLACAAYWFHPLVWTAAKQLRNESERACDDLALSCGARASDYAEHLLDIVTSVRHDSTPVVALAMARRKEFEGRMLAILDPELRHSTPTRRQTVSLIGSLAVIAVLVGAAAPAPRAIIKSTMLTQAPAVDSKFVPNDVDPKEQDAKDGDVIVGNRNYEKSISKSVQKSVQKVTATATATATKESIAQAIGDVNVGRISMQALQRLGLNVVSGRSLKGVVVPDDRPMLLANVLLNDADATLRRTAAWGLSEYADNDIAVKALTSALVKDKDPAVREMAAWALGNGDDRSSMTVDALSNALHSDANEGVRVTATWALGNIGAEEAVNVLTAAMQDKNKEIRARAIWAIGNIGPREAPKSLFQSLRDPDPRIRELSAWALYQIEDPSAAPALNAALQAESIKDLQIAYIRALAALGEKSVDAIRGLLTSSDPKIKSMAVRALAGGNAAGPWPWPWPEPRPYP